MKIPDNLGSSMESDISGVRDYILKNTGAQIATQRIDLLVECIREELELANITTPTGFVFACHVGSKCAPKWSGGVLECLGLASILNDAIHGMSEYQEGFEEEGEVE